MVEARLDWRGELAFGARVQGHELVITPAKREVDVGPSPMGLFLVAYASCTSMDGLSRDRYCSVSAMVAGPKVVRRCRIETRDGRLVAEGTVD
jgi:uncharacterized OsmC-like protein